MQVVTQLREFKSKFDILIDGKMVRLEIGPCDCGVEAKWVV